MTSLSSLSSFEQDACRRHTASGLREIRTVARGLGRGHEMLERRIGSLARNFGVAQSEGWLANRSSKEMIAGESDGWSGRRGSNPCPRLGKPACSREWRVQRLRRTAVGRRGRPAAAKPVSSILIGRIKSRMEADNSGGRRTGVTPSICEQRVPQAGSYWRATTRKPKWASLRPCHSVGCAGATVGLPRRPRTFTSRSACVCWSLR